MKNGWHSRNLSEVCDITMGTSPPGNTYNAVGEGMPLINGPVEFSPGSFGKTIRTKFTSAPNKLCKEHDLILCVRGSTTGRMNIADFDACIGRGVAAIRARDYQPWINWFVRYKRDHIYALGTGATFPNISSGALASLAVLMPPLPEQRRIVGILDEAFDGIATAKANAEQNLQNARALFESHLNAVFTQRGDGWVETKLGAVARFKNGLNYNRNSKGQTLPVVGVGDFQTNDLVPIDGLQSATIDGELDEGYAIRRNDILTVRLNGSKHLVGRCMLVPEVTEQTSYSGFVIRIRFDSDEISPKFLLHFMKSRTTRDRLTREGGGANISNINQVKLSSLPVRLPPFKVQENIVATLNEVSVETRRLESIYQRKLTALEELKKSLLHQAFSGQLLRGNDARGDPGTVLASCEM